MNEPSESRSSGAPILIALAVAAVAVAVVGIFALTRGDGLTDDLRVARAAVGQNDALQRQNYPDFRKYTCSAEQGNEAEVLARQQQSDTTKGDRFVDDVTGVVITGDRATATVVYHFERSTDDKIKTSMNFVREGGDWKVCSPGPS